jgi:hypothetical protein
MLLPRRFQFEIEVFLSPHVLFVLPGDVIPCPLIDVFFGSENHESPPSSIRALKLDAKRTFNGASN